MCWAVYDLFKKQYLSEKKIRAEGFTWKKNSCTSRERKKKSCKLEIPLPPHHFSNGPSLIVELVCVLPVRVLPVRVLPVLVLPVRVLPVRVLPVRVLLVRVLLVRVLPVRVLLVRVLLVRVLLVRVLLVRPLTPRYWPHHPYPRAFCSLPSFARIKRPRWRSGRTERSTSTISRKNRGLWTVYHRNSIWCQRVYLITNHRNQNPKKSDTESCFCQSPLLGKRPSHLNLRVIAYGCFLLVFDS